ncbi:MAG: glycosyltransferase family 4 protein [Bacteroidales bacterium]|nr:glycosyltransferase family 4 protein [Bacteroidales bacterium]MDD3891251.1 glycosyltransferase family 4 protein [Bacteroidales bacterium]MDY0201980.1 glycosyltransferase family 4 protein [Tenuifilaceae bacterium]
MRIIICCSFFPPIISGDGNSAYTLAQELSKLGNRITILSLNPNNVYPPKSIVNHIEIIRSYYLKNSFFNKLQSRYFYVKNLLFIINECDLIIVYGRMLGFWLILLVGLFYKKKLVYRSTLIGLDDSLTLKRKHPIFFRLLLKKIDFYFAINLALKDMWVKSGLLPSKVFASPQGVDLTVFKPCFDDNLKSTIKERENLPKNIPTICSIGDLCIRKGYFEVSDVLSKIDLDYNWIILGSDEPNPYLWGSKANGEEIYSVKKYLINNNKTKLKLIGQKQNPEDYLVASDIFIHFAKAEGTPNVVLQAMACGLPCIVKPIEAIVSLGLKNNIHCFFAETPNEISEKIIFLLLNFEKRRELGHNARIFAEEHFNATLIAEKFIRFILNS